MSSVIFEQSASCNSSPNQKGRPELIYVSVFTVFTVSGNVKVHFEKIRVFKDISFALQKFSTILSPYNKGTVAAATTSGHAKLRHDSRDSYNAQIYDRTKSRPDSANEFRITCSNLQKKLPSKSIRRGVKRPRVIDVEPQEYSLQIDYFHFLHQCTVYYQTNTKRIVEKMLGT